MDILTTIILPILIGIVVGLATILIGQRLRDKSVRQTHVDQAGGEVREARFQLVTALFHAATSADADAPQLAKAAAVVQQHYESLRVKVDKFRYWYGDGEELAKAAKRFKTQCLDPLRAGRLSPGQTAQRTREVADAFNQVFGCLVERHCQLPAEPHTVWRSAPGARLERRQR